MNSAAIRGSTFFRLLLESDAEAAFAVHCAATCHLQNDIVRKESLKFIRDQINDGFVIGGFAADGQLVAYAALSVDNSATSKISDLLELDPANRRKLCMLDGVAVQPAWQSRGIHHALIAERLCYARDLGKDIVGATVSPRNLKSIKNLLTSGFLVIQATLLYGGHERLILVRHLGSHAGTGYYRTKTIALNRFDESIEAIRSGLCGFELAWDEQGQAFMHYGTPSQK